MPPEVSDKLVSAKKNINEKLFEVQALHGKLKQDSRELNTIVKKIDARREDGDPVEFAQFNAMYGFYDQIRQNELSHISNPKYQERLAYELSQSGMTGAELFYLEKRKDALKDDYRIIPGNIVDETLNALGKYNPSEDVTYLHFDTTKSVSRPFSYGHSGGYSELPLTIDQSYKNAPKSVARHEFRHESTNSNRFISPYAQRLYQEAFLGSEIDLDSSNKDRNYFGTTTEIDARKRTFEQELEDLGIKKYEEDLTHEQYLKILEILSKSKNVFSPGSQEFIRSVKDEEYLLKIMNTIA